MHAHRDPSAACRILRRASARLLPVAVATLGLFSTTAHAGWNKTGAGPYGYLDTANWDGGVIDNLFPGTLTLTAAQTATFNGNHLATNGLNFAYVGNFGLTLRADGVAKTLTLGGNVTVAPASNVTVTIGSTTANQNLHLDLGGASRTLTVANGKTLWFWNNVVGSGGVMLDGAGTVVLRSLTSTFAGDIVVSNGTFVIGEQGGAIADACLGNPDNDVSLLNGATLKFGSNNDKAHVLLSPLRDFTLSGGAKFITPYGPADVNLAGNIGGTGGITLSGPIPLLSGNNTFTGGITYNGSVRFSSDANIGGSTSALTRGGNAGTLGLSILGTNLTHLTGHPMTYANSDGIFIEPQDPANVFTWNKVYNRGMNSGSNPTFVKQGLGTLLVTTNQTYLNSTGIATVLNGGVLRIDYAAGGSLLNGAGNQRLAFGSGALHLLGKASGVVTQTLSHVRLDAGGGALVVDNNGGSGSTTVTIGDFTNLTQSAGGSLNVRTVNPGSGSALARSFGPNDATGLLGAGRVTLNGSDWASVNATSNVVAYAGYTVGLPSSGSSAALNYSQTDSASVTASESINTLKLATTAGGQSLVIGAGQSLTTDTLLFTGANDYSISGGYLAGSLAVGANADLQIHHHGTGKLTIGSSITNGLGASTLTITGTGTVELASTNFYTGQTFVNGATLAISSNNQLNNGATTQLNLYASRLKVAETLSTGRPVLLGGGGATFDVANGKTLTLNNTVSGGRLILQNSDAGNGMLVLGAANSFANGVEINGGVLRLGNNAALHSIGLNTLQFGSATTQTLQIYGVRTTTVAGLSSSSANAIVENGAAGAALLNVYNGADNLFAGVLRDGAAGTLGFTKAGCGTLTLTGANTYTGATAVQGGTLAVNGSLAAGSAVAVQKGALGGTGTVAGTVNVASNAALAAGSGAVPGILTVGATTLQEGAVVACDVAGGAMDRVNVSGTLTLPVSATVNVTQSGALPSPAVLLSATSLAGASSVAGWQVSDPGLMVKIVGNTVVLQTPPPPGTIILVR